VDNPDPTLQPLQNCQGLKPLAKIACQAANSATTAQNNALLTAAAFVTPAQFSGATVTYMFGGPGFHETELEGAYSPAGGLRLLSSVDAVEGQVSETPEPASYALFGGGILLLAAMVKRRKRRF
jgi:hypothetical protein